MYASELADGDLINEFDQDWWICPDVKNITVLNNPALFDTGNGTDFYLTVTDCATAVQNDIKFGLTTYVDSSVVC